MHSIRGAFCQPLTKQCKLGFECNSLPPRARTKPSELTCMPCTAIALDDYDDDYDGDYDFKKLWRGSWQNSDIVAKILNVRECTVRISRDFKEEYPRLRCKIDQ